MRIEAIRANRRLWDAVAFFLVLAAAMLYALHGKPWASVLFSDGRAAFTRDFNNPRVYLTALAVVLIFTLMKLSSWSSLGRAAVSAAVAICGPLAIQFQSTGPSSMIFILHLYVCFVAAGITVVEPIFRMRVQPEFWKAFFRVLSKGMGYLFALFSAGLAVLQYVSKGLKEPIPGYLTSLAYPAGALLLSLVLVGFWLLAPAWQKYLATVELAAPNQAPADGRASRAAEAK